MATTQSRLEQLQSNLDESIGVRRTQLQPQLSPVPSSKDIGRRPLRDVAVIDIDQVIPDPSQPRLEFCEDAISRLAASIQRKGQLAPIRVRWSEPNEKWIIICGERRWRAIKEAGLPDIQCCFVQGNLTEAEILEDQLIENLLRENLKPSEQARGFAALMDQNNWNGKQVAAHLHIPASTVSRTLALLDLPPEIQEQVDTGNLATRAAYEISKLDSENQQRTIARRAQDKKLSLTEVRDTVRDLNRRTKRTRRTNGISFKFPAENGIMVKVTSKKKHNNHEILEALQEAVEEAQRRLDNNFYIA